MDLSKRFSSEHRWRAGRALHALSPEHIRIDERSEADLVAFAIEYARLLTFYDEHDRPKGDWQGFFDTDVSFLLAEMCMVDARQEYLDSLGLTESDPELNFKIEQAIRRINNWLVRAKRLPWTERDDSIEASLRATLHNAIKDELGHLLTSTLLETVIPARDDEEAAEKQSRELWFSTVTEKPYSPKAIYSALNRATRKLVE